MLKQAMWLLSRGFGDQVSRQVSKEDAFLKEERGARVKLVLPFAGERRPTKPRAGKFNGRSPHSHPTQLQRQQTPGKLQPPRP